MAVYLEDNNEEFGVSHIWTDAAVKDSVITHRGTRVDMIERPKWGLACYMDNSIQSALIDERIYHESLVHPAMMSVYKPERVMIIGGGEGATAREVLKWPGVEQVDMYEWDCDVVGLFRKKYPQWAQGAWNDSRLKVHAVDIFETIKTPPSRYSTYDVIIVDLFEPTDENKDKWAILLKSLNNWLSLDGSIVMYAGMRNILAPQQPYNKLIDMIQFKEVGPGHLVRDNLYSDRIILPYRVYVPSFSGESMFILLKNAFAHTKFNFEAAAKIGSHLTESVWNSYRALNW
jgi:predicted membrane-bound spermidine synthase